MVFLDLILVTLIGIVKILPVTTSLAFKILFLWIQNCITFEYVILFRLVKLNLTFMLQVIHIPHQIHFLNISLLLNFELEEIFVIFNLSKITWRPVYLISTYKYKTNHTCTYSRTLSGCSAGRSVCSPKVGGKFIHMC